MVYNVLSVMMLLLDVLLVKVEQHVLNVVLMNTLYKILIKKDNVNALTHIIKMIMISNVLFALKVLQTVKIVDGKIIH